MPDLDDGGKTHRFIRVGMATEVPAGSSKTFPIGNRSILVANVDGKYYAVDDRCSHDDGPLGEGTLVGCEVECPRHGARFDLATGEATCLPAVGPILVYSIDVREGFIFIGLP